MADIEWIQGEAKTLTFTDSNATDMSTATITMEIKKNRDDTAALVSKADVDFDDTNEAAGITAVDLSAVDTAQEPGIYILELNVYFAAANIDKTQFNVMVFESVI